MANFNIKGFVKIFVIFILIDLIWLKLFAGPKYKKMIYNIQGEPMKAKMGPAFLVYVFMTILFMLFSSQSDTRNFLLGFLTYGVYDFTNLAIFNKFDKTFALLDSIWGGILFTVVNRINTELKF
jgi:uncharacterized membrane protein